MITLQDVQDLMERLRREPYKQQVRFFNAGPSLYRALDLEGVKRMFGATILCGPGTVQPEEVERWREVIRREIPEDSLDRRAGPLTALTTRPEPKL